MHSNFLLSFLLILHEFAPIFSKAESNSTQDTPWEGQENINVVLFLAHTDYNVNYEKDEGLAFLNISLVGKIKPCTSHPESNLPPDFQNVLIRHNEQKECDCKKLLESSIFSLMGWARNAMGMAAAVVSLTCKQKIKDKDTGSNYYNYKFQTIDAVSEKSKQGRESLKRYNTEEVFEELPLGVNKDVKTDDLPKLEQEANQMEHDIPIIHAYPREPKLKFNDIHKYHRNKLEDFVNVRRSKRKIKVYPENTQVFELGSSYEEPREILEIPSLKRAEQPETIWDLLGLMSAIRSSFFINFMNPMLDPHQRMLDEESGMNFDLLGEVRAPSLFQLVKTALHQLQQEAEETHAKGYLLIVFGGNLIDISDPHSDLIQSIKHVRETTDAEHTLSIVTGSCPKDHSHDDNHQATNTRKEEYLLPVYAKGPNAEVLAKAQELFDIPVQIKEAIKGNSSEEESSKIEKRSVNLEIANNNALFDINAMDNKKEMFNENGDSKKETESLKVKREALKKQPSNSRDVVNKSVKLTFNLFTFFVLFTLSVGM